MDNPKARDVAYESCPRCAGKGWRWSFVTVDRWASTTDCEDCVGTGELEVAA